MNEPRTIEDAEEMIKKHAHPQAIADTEDAILSVPREWLFRTEKEYPELMRNFRVLLVSMWMAGYTQAEEEAKK